MRSLGKPRRTYLPAFREWIRHVACIVAVAPKNEMRLEELCDGWRSPSDTIVSEAAHVRSRGSGGDDPNNLVSLCAKHHRWGKDSLHALNVKGFDKRWGLSVEKIARRLYRTWRQETQA